MTDRELLEAAARAAGIYYWIDGDAFVTHDDTPCCTREWNPLEDDGDALRLAVKLELRVSIIGDGMCEVTCPKRHLSGVFECDHDGDLASATRRAIVRAAAAMAKSGEN